ncbi:MAG: YvcK family protein [Ktedonobacterales bacterium]|jgi:uncharacterized cofD-like protein|nr:MAG: YvcK family protein [Ktedonobacterales bacterium]
MDYEQGDQVLSGLKEQRIVTIGGGTGPFALLSYLKHHDCAITAIVTMADSGGSSRRLMDEFGQLPLGDLRQALVALSRKDTLWRDLFAYRFRKPAPRAEDVSLDDLPGARSPKLADQAGVSGHSLGNLMISALQDLKGGDLLLAIRDAQEILDTAGDVLPITLAHTTLCAETSEGERIQGESEIDTRGERHPGPLAPISQITLHRQTPPCEEAINAIHSADVIILGPGDLYTSVLPSLLVDGVAQAIRASAAHKVYVSNLMTKHGETDGFTASRFVGEIHRYLGGPVDRVILHDGSFPDHLLDLYAAKQQHPVQPDVDAVRQLVADVVVDNVLAIHGEHFVRHDAERLLRAAFAPLLVPTNVPSRSYEG